MISFNLDILKNHRGNLAYARYMYSRFLLKCGRFYYAVPQPYPDCPKSPFSAQHFLFQNMYHSITFHVIYYVFICVASPVQKHGLVKLSLTTLFTHLSQALEQ